MPGESGDKLTLSDCPQTYVKRKSLDNIVITIFINSFI